MGHDYRGPCKPRGRHKRMHTWHARHTRHGTTPPHLLAPPPRVVPHACTARMSGCTSCSGIAVGHIQAHAPARTHAHGGHSCRVVRRVYRAGTGAPVLENNRLGRKLFSSARHMPPSGCLCTHAGPRRRRTRSRSTHMDVSYAFEAEDAHACACSRQPTGSVPASPTACLSRGY